VISFGLKILKKYCQFSVGGPVSGAFLTPRSGLSFFDQKLQFTYVQATGETFCPKRKDPALQKMKFINFFLCLWVIFALRIRIANPA
jgi:hypothetical protein